MNNIRPQEHGLARLQSKVVQEVDGEAANITWIFVMQSCEEVMQQLIAFCSICWEEENNKI